MQFRNVIMALGVIMFAALARPALATTINFEGIAASDSFSFFGNGPLTISGATITGDGNIFVIDQGFYGTPYSSAYLSISEGGSTNSLTIALPSAIHAISFDFGALFVGASVSGLVSLNGGPAATINSVGSIEAGVLQSFYFSSHDAISQVVLTLPNSPYFNAIDNFSFMTAVPEISTWAMMMFGFLGVGLLACARRARTQRLVS